MALLIDTEGVDLRRRASHFLDAMMASRCPRTTRAIRASKRTTSAHGFISSR
jgi:hypothetical protein